MTALHVCQESVYPCNPTAQKHLEANVTISEWEHIVLQRTGGHEEKVARHLALIIVKTPG